MSFPHLGQTRSSHGGNHLLQTPDTFVRAPLPGMERATAIIHAAPALGAEFLQYTAELQTEGRLGPTEGQRFIYVVEGGIKLGDRLLAAGGFAYLPEGDEQKAVASEPSRLAVIEKHYEPLNGVKPPSALTGHVNERPENPLNGDAAVRVRTLLPDTFHFDFAVNTMTYDPGASLSMVEIHVMEHGLLMLAGQGIYRLDESWYPVTAGDFIWMGPYCPQWFGALGKTPATYLIYKNWNRSPL